MTTNDIKQAWRTIAAVSHHNRLCKFFNVFEGFQTAALQMSQSSLYWRCVEGKVWRVKNQAWTYGWPGQRSSCPRGSVAPDRSGGSTWPVVDWSEDKHICIGYVFTLVWSECFGDSLARVSSPCCGKLSSSQISLHTSSSATPSWSCNPKKNHPVWGKAWMISVQCIKW